MLFEEERKEINVDLPTHLFHIYYFNNHLVTGFEFRLNLAQWEELPAEIKLVTFMYLFLNVASVCWVGAIRHFLILSNWYVFSRGLSVRSLTLRTDTCRGHIVTLPGLPYLPIYFSDREIKEV